ncbi:MAG: hypothetical protein M3Y87_30860 [Myxococcota bacterium]|nr:hypothetical protein [Myxococcota bacterium]
MRLGIASIVFSSFVLALTACDTPPPVRGCASSSDCVADQVCVDGRCRVASDGGTEPSFDGGPRPDAHTASVTGIHVEPASATVTAIDGAMSTVDFELIADYDDGTTAALATGFWSADAPLVGEIDRESGVYAAGGVIAGSATVTVEALGRMASATVSVRIERNVLAEGAPADAADRFTGAPVSDPARAAALLYPLEGTLFPENVYPADVQWEGGVAGDLYRVRMDADGVAVRAYVAHAGGGFGYHWQVTREAWRAIAESAPETDVTIAIDRWEASSGAVIEGAARTVRFADAVIRGSIYYWDLGAGRILRIAGDGTGRETFMPSPPRRPSDGAQCVACHAISRDGRRMAAGLWDGGDFGAIFDLTGDTTADPPPMIVTPTVQRFLTASFNSDASRLVASNANELFLMDGATGARLPAGGAGLPAAAAAHPSWSPDDQSIVFVSNTDGGWAVDFTRGDLSIIDALPGDLFAAPRTIFTGAPLVAARPSWTPDSHWIAFQHGQHSRAYQDLGAGGSVLREATIRMVGRDGTAVFDLERLNAGDRHSFYPTFSPFTEGGYFWLAFFSTRDYGNAQVGTRGAARRQLWVAAIDATPAVGSDPSFAPYWLPQQDVSQENMAAFWTEEACRADGLGCATSGECCGGFCRDAGDGPVCVPPDLVECSRVGEACRVDADCCEGEGLTCISNRCGTLG